MRAHMDTLVSFRERPSHYIITLVLLFVSLKPGAISRYYFSRDPLLTGTMASVRPTSHDIKWSEVIHFEGGYERANRDDGALRRGEARGGKRGMVKKGEGKWEGRDRENADLSKRSERHSEGDIPLRPLFDGEAGV